MMIQIISDVGDKKWVIESLFILIFILLLVFTQSCLILQCSGQSCYFVPKCTFIYFNSPVDHSQMVCAANSSGESNSDPKSMEDGIRHLTVREIKADNKLSFTETVKSKER